MITLILLQLYFDKYVFINVFFNIFQICYYRFSMYLNAKQKVHLHNAMDNYKPRANFSTMHKFHNPLTKLGRICTRRIDLTYAQHVNMKAHHSSAPFCNSKSNKYLVFIKLYSFYTIIDHMYSHVYKFFYISIVEYLLVSRKRNFLFAKSAPHCVSCLLNLERRGTTNVYRQKI